MRLWHVLLDVTKIWFGQRCSRKLTNAANKKPFWKDGNLATIKNTTKICPLSPQQGACSPFLIIRRGNTHTGMTYFIKALGTSWQITADKVSWADCTLDSTLTSNKLSGHPRQTYTHTHTHTHPVNQISAQCNFFLSFLTVTTFAAHWFTDSSRIHSLLAKFNKIAFVEKKINIVMSCFKTRPLTIQN